MLTCIPFSLYLKCSLLQLQLSQWHYYCHLYNIINKYVIFKLSILNQHRFIISYQNRLPVIFVLTLISQF